MHARRLSSSVRTHVLGRRAKPRNSGHARCLHIVVGDTFQQRPKLNLTESYIHNPSTTPFLATTLGRLIDHQAETIGDKVGYVVSYQDIRKTYADLKQDADHLAAGLVSLGMKPGERIGIWGPNSYEWIVTMFAASKAGLILVNVNPAYKVSELEYCLNKVQVKTIVAAEGVATLNYYDHFKQLITDLDKADPRKLKSARLPHLQKIVMLTKKPTEFPGTIPFSEVMELGTTENAALVEEINRNVQPDSAFNVQFTSGTTGTPKGATLSYFGLMNAAYFSGHRFGAGAEVGSLVCPLPLYHVFGCVGNLVTSTIFGTKAVFPSEKFDPKAALQAIQDERGIITSGQKPTVEKLSGIRPWLIEWKGKTKNGTPRELSSSPVYCDWPRFCLGQPEVYSIQRVPTMWRDMIDQQKEHKFDLSSLKYGIMGGAPCPPELVKEVQEEMGVKFFSCGYGSTEQGLSSFVGFIGDPPEVYTTTTGFPLDHVEAKIVDSEGRIVPIGQTGELLTRTFGTMLGYWGEEEKTKETIRPDRWMYSGDLGTLSVDGDLKIVGRVKDMIIRGGENVYPVEIENVLYECGLVQDVHVCGVPDRRMGEEICAWIRLADGEFDPDNRTIIEEQMRAFCQKELANYKTPRYFVFFKSSDDIPMTVTGKVQRFKLTDRSVKKLGLNQKEEEKVQKEIKIKRAVAI